MRARRWLRHAEFAAGVAADDQTSKPVPLAMRTRRRFAASTITRYVNQGEVWPAARVDLIWDTGTDADVTADGWS